MGLAVYVGMLSSSLVVWILFVSYRQAFVSSTK
jgi:hypothetical protein